eukprot:TRINITY_DN11430_c0_g1_i1.p1 TRINITY_DN11430_c0_g1~~TRINITY_DN11430_c0_g1_i1.p1  ORF type:complete len:386 (+),score=50.74 TRINITY_DN11430_c0_g1_i1:43-1158(+)
MLAFHLLATATYATTGYKKIGELNVTDAHVVHVPRENDQFAYVGTKSKASVIIMTDWKEPRENRTIDMDPQCNEKVQAITSTNKGELIFVASGACVTVLNATEEPPTMQQHVLLPTAVKDLALAGDILYVSTTSLYSIDVSTETFSFTPQELASDFCGDKLAVSDHIYATCLAQSAVSVFNTTGAVQHIFQFSEPPTDVLVYDRLYIQHGDMLTVYVVGPPMWEPTNVQNISFASVGLGLARSWPDISVAGQVFVATGGEVRMIETSNVGLSSYIAGPDGEVSSVSVFGTTKLFTVSVLDGNEQFTIFDLKKPKSVSPTAVLAVVIGAIFVAFIAGAIFYYYNVHHRQGTSGERESFRGDRTADREFANYS